MSSTPFTSCSIGAATVSAMTSAEAPGYVALMLTVGGTISGYSEIGSDCCAIAPAIVRISESTVAKTGRSMKKWESRIEIRLFRGRLVSRQHDVARYRGHNRPRANGRICQTGNHHPLILGQAGRDDAKTFLDWSQCHRLDLNLVIRPNRINDFATLIRGHGRVRDEQGFDVATEKAQTPKCPGRQEQILIVHHGPSANGARLAVELVVDEVHPSVSYPLFLICETDLNDVAGHA